MCHDFICNIYFISTKYILIHWYDSKPKSNWEEKEGLKTMTLLSSLDTFGMVLLKRESQLSLFLGTIPTDTHHITSIPDITSAPCILPNIFFENTYTMKLRYDYIHPLTILAEPCKIYEQSSLLGDFSFSVLGNRADPKGLRKRAKSHLEKLKKRSGDIKQNDITKPVEFKLEQNHFFACSVFFSCGVPDVEPFLSSLNFTRKLAMPNGLVTKKKIKTDSLLNTIPKLSWFGGSKTPILSLVEIASILSLPTTLFGLEMRSGADKTFSNLRGTVDPAKFFENLGEK